MANITNAKFVTHSSIQVKKLGLHVKIHLHIMLPVKMYNSKQWFYHLK